MKTFEDLFIAVCVERSNDPDRSLKLSAENFESVKKVFPIIGVLHEAFVEAAKRYADQNRTEWISVNDRLPIINQDWWADPVLVCLKHPFADKPRALWFCSYMQNGEWRDNEGQTFENVTHWMENPAFPDYTP
jgi:hypothetical protein